MPDLLVNLLKLSALDSAISTVESEGIVVRRAQPGELTRAHSFVESAFSVAWADEISVGFANKPVSVHLAVVEREIVGFAGDECTRRGFFGPAGVAEQMQGRGVGKALLIAGLWALRELRYVYAIVGRAGPVEFYEKTVGAIVIPDSDPGIYSNLLK